MEKKEEFLNLVNQIPYYSFLGMQVVDLGSDFAKIELNLETKHKNFQGGAHGGVIFSLADSAAALAAYIKTEGKNITTTVEAKINFLVPADCKKLIAFSKVVYGGKKIIVCDTEVKNEQEVLIAKGLVTCFVLGSS